MIHSQMIQNILLLKKYAVLIISLSYISISSSSTTIDYIFITIIFGIIYTLLYFRLVDNNYRYLNLGSYSDKFSLPNITMIILPILAYNSKADYYIEYLNMIPTLVLLSMLTLLSMLVLKYRHIHISTVILFPILFFLADYRFNIIYVDTMNTSIFYNNTIFIGTILTATVFTLTSLFHLL